MVKRTKALFMAAAVSVLLTSGCQNKDQSGSIGTKIYYTAIESGDY